MPFVSVDPRKPILSRNILAPHDLLVDVRQAQRLAMFFDHILIWPLDRGSPSAEDTVRVRTDLQYLVEQGIVRVAGVDLGVRIGNASTPHVGINPFAGHFLVPMAATLAGLVGPRSPGIGDVDRIIRSVASTCFFDGAPITAHLQSSVLASSQAGPPCLEIALNKVPMPPEGIPWESLVQFRKDAENVHRLRMLRIWLQKRALDTTTSARLVEEELETLLYDYRKYMKLQHRRYGDGMLSAVLVSVPDAVEHMLNLRFGSALRTVLDVRARNIALTEAEMKAPGREVSYVSRAADLRS